MAEEKRKYATSLHLYISVEASTVEEAFQRVYNNVRDAIYYMGDATLTAVGDEDEIEASLRAEWRNGVLSKVETEREVF